MLMVPPIEILDANLVTSNVVEELPHATSGTTFDPWDKNVSYSPDDKVAHVGPVYQGENVSKANFLYAAERGYSFNIWKALFGVINLEPGQVQQNLSENTLPGYWAWVLEKSFPVWDDEQFYAQGMIVGNIVAGIGRLFQSLIPNNMGNDPSSNPTQWRQVGDTYDTYAGGTTYNTGTRVAVFFGTRGLLFESLRDTNTGHPPQTSPIWWKYIGESYKTYEAIVSYAKDDVVIDPQTHTEYVSLVGSNVGAALTDNTKWLARQPTNRWRMFDASNSSQTVVQDELDVTIQLVGNLCDTVALMNIQAATVRIIATDAIDGVVYDETYSMESTAGITSWYDYFFEPIVRPIDFLAVDLPNYAGLKIRIIASDPGNLVSVGTVVFGKSREFGYTVLGAELGIHDFSRKEQDDFGNWQIVPRAFSKTTDFTVVCQKEKVDMIHQLLAAYRTKAVLYIASDDYSASWALGYFKDFKLNVAYPLESHLTLQIEGLT